LKEQLDSMQKDDYHDDLTGLPNRRLFTERLDNRIVHCQRYGDISALLFVDIDNLESVNDAYGHAAGDLMVIRLSQLLNVSVESSDVAARIGSNIFALLLDNLDADQVERKIAFLIDRIKSADCKYQDVTLPFRASIGYCFIGPKDSVDGLMSRADAAMYRSQGSFD
jgi:diguanylate cyclase (GGDEF)-like protein